jgi:sugar/nucleoside kinase (ribokinase family)
MTQNSRVDDTTGEAVAACRRDLPSPIPVPDTVLGFDGFVDTVRRVVDERHDAESFDPMTELGAFGERIAASADERSSITVEWTRDGTRTGGHTCHVARALIGLGGRPTMIGAYGDPERDVFADEFGAARRYSFGEPNYTEAVEFDDGKLLVTETGATRTLDWETLADAVGVETLAARLDGADVLGMGYWVVIPDFPSILTGLRERVWPTLDDPPGTVLVDPGDVRQLADDVLTDGIEPLRRFATVAPVTLSANRAEMFHLADALDAPSGSLSAAATAVRDRLGLRRAVAHAADASVAAGPERTVSVAVPRVADPAMTTSAGDHFNVGLALGLSAGLSDSAAVCLGNATAGVFVRTGDPPTEASLRAFLDRYLDAFDDA